VPTVVVGTDEFQALARLESKNRGLDGLPLALVKHPLGGIRDDEVARKADTIVDAVVEAVSTAHAAGAV
jgi:hypothetical protein